MGGGIIIGVFWGLVVSVLVTALLSLSAPLPPRGGPPVEVSGEMTGDAPDMPETAPLAAPAPDAAPQIAAEPAPEPAEDGAVSIARQAPAEAIPLPAGSEFNRPPPDEAAVLPQADRAPGMAAPEAPPAPEASVSSGVDTAPPPQPGVVAVPVSPGPMAPAPGDAIAVARAPQVARGADDTPPQAAAAPPAQVAVPGLESGALPDMSARPPPSAAPVAVPATAPETAPASGEAAETAREDTAAPEAAPDTGADTTASPPALVRLVPPSAGTDAPGKETAPDTTAGDTVAGEAAMPRAVPRVIRPGTSSDEVAGPGATGGVGLPQIVNPGRTDSAPQAGVAASPEPAPEAVPETEAPTPALEAFAAPFDAAEARALIAVVLIDEPDPRLDLETLTSLGLPVAFAIDPARPDAAERAAAYRAAGFEVLMLGTVIPEGATASDTEVALAAARARVPEAIALMDTVDSRIQSDRTVLEAVVGVAAGEGQGLVAFPRGLNTAEQMAARSDVPSATFFRLLDDEDQRATVITRYLSRAEFAAAQEGAVVVAGRTRPDTVTALVSWALGSRNEGVVIAPVSAALQRLAGLE